ncbi:hypothetical protein [Streptomyces lancefieldiae]|uniref:Uncharacterized protein n=1 Tax=Streptomyces lancefieldiae TaxID=3075520 RepID=A0ABU3B2D9_9ACTN|nr:hypothetical protein [Streptomyces sp. DSM 40712]MDT0616235.1 hypothetical protein [Streptomyces sp. DSM 40712]
MNAARLLARLLGSPHDVPMTGLLDLDQREFNRRVGVLLHTDVAPVQPGVARCAVRARLRKGIDA